MFISLKINNSCSKYGSSSIEYFLLDKKKIHEPRRTESNKRYTHGNKRHVNSRMGIKIKTAFFFVWFSRTIKNKSKAMYKHTTYYAFILYKAPNSVN